MDPGLLLVVARPSRCTLGRAGTAGRELRLPCLTPPPTGVPGDGVEDELSPPAREQQHLSHSNAADCCFCSSLESQSRGFRRKQPRLKHLPTSAEEQSPAGQLQTHTGPCSSGHLFLSREFKLYVARRGPGLHDGKTQLGRNTACD